MNEPQPSLAAVRDTSPVLDLVLRIYCWVVVLPVLYVASAGPMYWYIFEAFHLERYPLVAAAYFPLVVWASKVEFIADFLDWYIGLWIF